MITKSINMGHHSVARTVRLGRGSVLSPTTPRPLANLCVPAGQGRFVWGRRDLVPQSHPGLRAGEAALAGLAGLRPAPRSAHDLRQGRAHPRRPDPGPPSGPSCAASRTPRCSSPARAVPGRLGRQEDRLRLPWTARTHQRRDERLRAPRARSAAACDKARRQ